MLITDIETNGLLDTVSKFHCAFIYDTRKDEYIGYRPQDFEAYLKALQEENDRGGLIVFHNGIKYDIPALNKLAEAQGIPFKIDHKNVLDTLVLSRLIYSNVKDTDNGYVKSGKLPGKLFGSQSLEAWGYRLGKMKGEYKYDFKKRLEDEGEHYESGMEWLFFNEEMYDYCKQDVVVTAALTDKLLNNKWYFKNNNYQTMESEDFWKSSIHAVTLEHEAAWLLAKQEANGFPFDTKSATRLYTELAAKRSELLVELQDTFGSWYRAKGGNQYYIDPQTGKENLNVPKVKYPKCNRRPYVKDCPHTPVEFVVFNPSSREHIALKLQEAGWIPTEFTESGQPKVDDEILSKASVPDPEKQKAIDLIKDYLMIQKRIGQVAEGANAWLKHDKNGYIHGSVNPNGAVTGRATHSFPNVAQVPSATFDKQHNKVYGLDGKYGTECREVFGAIHHKDGWVQAGVDASGLELRCLAHFMFPYDEGEYVHTILNGDIHTKNQMAAGLPTRDGAKTFIYGFLYGAGDEKIAEIVGGTAKEGKELKAKFLSNTLAIKLLRENLQNALVESSKWSQGRQIIKWRRKFIKGLDGRIVNVRSPHSALNTLLQSAGAIICKEWIVETEKLLTRKGYKHGWDGDFAYMAWVHDEMQIACRTKEIAEDVITIAQQAMRNVQAFYGFRCQLDTEGKIGETWADCH